MTHKKVKELALIGSGGAFVIIASSLTTLALAHGGDTNLIHACVKTSNSNNANIRIVGENDTCNNNEVTLDWSKDGSSASYAPGLAGVPFHCAKCSLSESPYLAGKDLTDAWLRQSDISSTDLTDTIFVNATLNNTRFDNSQVSGADFTGAYMRETDFSYSVAIGATFVNADLQASALIFADFSNANFSGATIDSGALQGSIYTNADFTSASIQNTVFNDINATQTNFTNANFTDANLQGALFMADTNRTGVIWSNTICPDGTNSDTNGNTCEGHF